MSRSNLSWISSSVLSEHPRNNEIQQAVVEDQCSEARGARIAPTEPESRQAEDDEVEAHRVDVRDGYDRLVRLGDETSDTWLPLGLNQDA